ncbi:MAG TPA: TatD family hydrolase [Myxococcaceae bacterium]|nr:TatD family hydrolase [Myxococcaceae bacterium]
MIDTHCHLDAPRLDDDRDEVLARAWQGGVTGIVVPAVGPDSWEALLRWPRKEPRVQVALGIHPQMLPHLPPEKDGEHLERLDELLARKGAIAVGECGIDGPSVPGAPMERQLAVLERHFELAQKHGLPVLVHVFRVQPQMVEFLKTHPIPDAGCLMHSYSGGGDLVKFYGKKGCHFSFAGPVTFQEARKPLDALRAVPLDRLMAETDAPDQAPHPHRGRRCEPGYLPLVVGAMAKALGLPAGELEERTAENARRFFRESFGSGSR